MTTVPTPAPVPRPGDVYMLTDRRHIVVTRVTPHYVSFQFEGTLQTPGRYPRTRFDGYVALGTLSCVERGSAADVGFTS